MTRALIYDLDNTLYPVKSISNKLFANLFKLIDEKSDGISKNDIQAAKDELTRRPFQKVAEKYNFSDELKKEGTELLRGLTFNEPIQTYDDYKYVKKLSADKFLVTSGFIKMQTSKIKMMGISNDFKKAYIIDPDTTNKTKKDIFEDILKKYGYKTDEVLIIGDDPESEIAAAKELGIKDVLYDPDNRYTTSDATYKIVNHQEISQLILL